MSGTILLADDSPTIQKVVELTFSETPHEVVTASSGGELIDKLSEVEPDLVICDVIMPDRDGYDLCQAIKSDPATLHIPVVMLTGTFEPFDRDRAMAVGADEIVTKPFEARQLIDTVERLLGGGPPVEEEAAAPSPESEEYGTFLVQGGEGSDEAPEKAEGEAPELAAEPFGVDEAEKEPAETPDEGEEGLDFTASGFAEMEAKGREAESGDLPEPGPPEPESEDEGLDFTTTGFDRMEAAGRAEMGEEPEPEPQTEPETEAEPEPETGPEVDLPIGERSEDEGVSVGESSWEDSFGETEEAEEEPVSEMDETAASVPEEAPEPVEPEAPELQPAEPEEPMGTESPVPAEPEEPEETEKPPEALPEEPEQPEAPPLSVPEADEAMPGAGSLSDEDVERIARRVVELQSSRLEQIAWEVIPDMAELVVRERIEQLENEIDSEEDE